MDIEILNDIRTLLKMNILPRLTELECQVDTLRKVTWPVCQGLQDQKDGVLATIPSKYKFFAYLDNEQMKELLSLKAKFTGSAISHLEFYEITKRLERPAIPATQ